MQRKTRKNFHGHKKARGVALLEILIAIGILGLIAAGVATLASRTFEAQSANDINEDLTDMAISIQNGFKRTATYTATTDNTVEALSDANVIADSAAINPETSDFYGFFPAARTATSTDDAFVITVDALSPSLCTTLVTGGLLEDAEYVEVTIGGTAPTAVDFSVTNTFTTGTPSGIIKTTTDGVSELMSDPLEAFQVCENPSNMITAGYY